MADQKKPGPFDKEKLVLQAAKGFCLPVRYQDKWVRVKADAPVEFVVAELPYESKIEIKSAIAAKQVFETVIPAPAPAAKAPADPQPKAAAKA